MNALGMIELYGKVAAVEALDSALKAANVSLVNVTRVGAGLVTVMITGDVGAVKAAIEAAEASARKVGTVVAVHVIPRPTVAVAEMVGKKPTLSPVKIAEKKPSLKSDKLEELKVVELRSMARELGIVDMTRKEIKFANKEELLVAIRKYLEQE